jgi:hypothetical protein
VPKLSAAPAPTSKPAPPPTLGHLAVQSVPATVPHEWSELVARKLNDLLSDNKPRQSRALAFFRGAQSMFVDAAFMSFFTLVGFVILMPMLIQIPLFRKMYTFVLGKIMKFGTAAMKSAFFKLAELLRRYVTGPVFNATGMSTTIRKLWKLWEFVRKKIVLFMSDLSPEYSDILKRIIDRQWTPQLRRDFAKILMKYQCNEKMRLEGLVVINAWIFEVQNRVNMYTTYQNYPDFTKNHRNDIKGALSGLKIMLEDVTKLREIFTSNPEFGLGNCTL